MSNPQVRDALRRLKPLTVLLVVAAVVLSWSVSPVIFSWISRRPRCCSTFGRFTRLAEPGLHFKLPFGIQRNYNVPTQVVLKDEFGFRTDRPGVVSIRATEDFPEESVMLTGDLNIVDVEWIIQSGSPTRTSGCSGCRTREDHPGHLPVGDQRAGRRPGHLRRDRRRAGQHRNAGPGDS